MVEAVPEKPYHLPLGRSLVNDSNSALASLMERRNEMNDRLFAQGLSLLSMPSFPTLGRGRFFDSADDEIASLAGETDLSKYNPASESTYILDKLANPHNRFPTLMRNIRERRGKKVEIKVPVF